MIYLLYFVHSWLVFVTPLKFLRYKSTVGQKILFTVVYGAGVIFSRDIYKFLKVPFGTHTILLIILSIILFKNILKDFNWQRSIYITLITFVALLVNDSLILVPIMKLFNLPISKIETDNILAIIFMGILSNLLLILVYIISIVRDLICSRKSFKQHYS